MQTHLVAGASARKRKVLTGRHPLCRRKITTSEAPQLEKEEKRKRGNPNSSRGSEGGSRKSTSSDNIPLRNMIPKTAKKRMDCRDPSPPLP